MDKEETDNNKRETENLLTPENMLKYIAHENVRDDEVFQLDRDRETRIEVAKEKLNKLYDLFKEVETEVGEFDFKKWNHNDRINASCLIDEAWMEITLYLFEKEEAYGIN